MYILGFYKGGKKESPAQYRPIALSSHIAKILERVVRVKLIEYLDINNLMDNAQHGSRKGRSTLS